MLGLILLFLGRQSLKKNRQEVIVFNRFFQETTFTLFDTFV